MKKSARELYLDYLVYRLYLGESKRLYVRRLRIAITLGVVGLISAAVLLQLLFNLITAR